MPLRCIAQSHSFDQAVEEAGRSSPLPHLSDHGFIDACRKVERCVQTILRASWAAARGYTAMASNSQKAIKIPRADAPPHAGLHHGSSRPRARAHLCRASPSRGSRPSRRSSRCGTTALWYRNWSRPWSGCWTRRRRSISSRSRRSSWRSPASSRPRRARVSRALPLRSVFVSLAASRRRLDGLAGSLCANDSSLPPRTSRRALWCLALRTVCADPARQQEGLRAALRIVRGCRPRYLIANAHQCCAAWL